MLSHWEIILATETFDSLDRHTFYCFFNKQEQAPSYLCFCESHNDCLFISGRSAMFKTCPLRVELLERKGAQ